MNFQVISAFCLTISAKDHERVRRAGVGSTPYNLSLNTPLPRRKDIMGKNENKRQLMDLDRYSRINYDIS